MEENTKEGFSSTPPAANSEALRAFYNHMNAQVRTQILQCTASQMTKKAMLIDLAEEMNKQEGQIAEMKRKEEKGRQKMQSLLDEIQKKGG